MRTDGIAGLERGYVATTCMRAIGLPFYFGTYNASKRALGLSSGGGEVAYRLPKIMLAGGIAGFFFWGVSFPLDFLKTRLQTQPEGSARVGLLKLIRQIYTKEGGARAFFAGYAPCLLRAAPANAVVFVGVEATLSAFGYSDF